MIGQRSDKPINAADLLERRDRGISEVEGLRGEADLSAGRGGAPSGLRGMLLLGGGVLAVIVGTVTWQAVAKNHEAAPKKAETARVASLSKGFKPSAVSTDDLAAEEGAESTDPDTLVSMEPIDAQSAIGSTAGQPRVPAVEGGQGDNLVSGGRPTPGYGPPPPKPPSPAELVLLRRLQPGLGNSGNAMRPTPAATRPAPANSDSGGELSQALRPMRLSSEQAARLGDRNYLLTKGSMIDCALTTRLVSTVPGMVACTLTRDVYSANGKVVLLDRGSKVVGFYQSGVKQGQPRIFVQWSRVETTQGVVVNLDSPGTGPLGEGGVDGKLDTHFRERFGGAILLSMIDDLGDFFANRRSNSQDIQFSNSGDAAKELAKVTLEASINIPPTLYKNQGERVAIFVARDLDFGGVYGLARR